MISKHMKYLIFSLTGYVSIIIYVIVFFYLAKYFHISESSFEYFIFNQFYLVFLAIGIIYMVLAINIRKTQKHKDY